ncbi:MAG: Amuc_1100 family pilus-like protein [Verrucomicrobiae bacterium]|nr:Amuc_1100 family pilus-like protein [Verrucomicrobiae bacterium]
MKGNVWLAGFLVFSVIAIGGAGFFFAKGKGAFNEAHDGWDSLAGKIERLEKEVPYPNEDNQGRLEETISGYQSKIDQLFQTLNRYQRPLNTQAQDTEFPNVVKEKVVAFQKEAEARKIEIKDRENFYLLMNEYQTTFPNPDIVPLLTYELDGIERLHKGLLEAGILSLDSGSREHLPGEKDMPASPPGEVVQRYPVQICFTTSHRGYQEFVNKVSNDKEFFFIIRVMRVENSAVDASEVDGGEDTGLAFVNAEGREATAEEKGALGAGTLPQTEFMEAMANAGWTLKRQDAKILFGQETLNVCMVIDIVRFLSPDELAKAREAEKAAKEADKGAKGSSRRPR